MWASLKIKRLDITHGHIEFDVEPMTDKFVRSCVGVAHERTVVRKTAIVQEYKTTKIPPLYKSSL